MSLIFPKKEILYAPMLGTLGGGSARGFGRGIGGGGPVGGVLYTSGGFHNFTAPEGVTSVCVVCIGGGGGGSLDHDGSGGAGGGLGWKNNISVVSGTNYSVYVGLGGDKESTQGFNSSGSSLLGANGNHSYFISTSTVKGGGGEGGQWGGSGASSYGGDFVGDGGGNGGDSSYPSYPTGGGGAGGYSGHGGEGLHKNALSNALTVPNGGGGGGGAGIDNYFMWPGGSVGIYGQGASGANGEGQAHGWASHDVTSARIQSIFAGQPGSGGDQAEPFFNPNGNLIARGGAYGAGGGAGFGTTNYWSSRGGHGAVRVIWGSDRAFPSTNVDLASSTDGETTV